MNIFMHLQKVLLGRVKGLAHAEKVRHTLFGMQHFQTLLEDMENIKEKEDIQAAQDAYSEIIDQIQKASVHSDAVLVLFYGFFLQIENLLSSVSSHKRECLYSIQQEAAGLAVHQIYVCIEHAAGAEEESPSLRKTIYGLLPYIPQAKLTAMKMRYLAKRQQSIVSKRFPRSVEVLEEIIQREVTKYCLFFNVQDISMENAFALEGFVSSLVKKTPGFSEDDLKKIKENIEKRKGRIFRHISLLHRSAP